MPTYELRASNWIEANEEGSGRKIEGPRLTVSIQGDDQTTGFILFVGSEQLADATAKLPQTQRELWVQRLRDALWRHAVTVVERSLIAESFEFTGRTIYHHMSKDEWSRVMMAVVRKSCSYQTRAGRDLLCEATHGEGPQPTAKSLCLGCKLPDDEYLCSSLTNPRVRIQFLTGGAAGSSMHALCDEGSPSIAMPDGCKPEGHECWRRIVETVPIDSSAVFVPRALPEALDFLDATWRLAFGKGHPLLRLRRTEDVLTLVDPCASRGDFKSAVSVLDDLIKQMLIADDLLDAADRADPNNQGDKTLNRLTACIRRKLPTEAQADALEAVGTLRRVNDVRVSLQHSGSAATLGPALATLGVTEPPDWPKAWDQIRRRTIQALVQLRKALQPLAEQ